MFMFIDFIFIFYRTQNELMFISPS